MKRFKKQISIVITFVIILTAIAPIQALAADVGGRDISSSGACVIDFDTGIILYEYEADTQRVPASMTKLISVYVIYEAVGAGELSMDDVTRISAGVSQLSNNWEYSNVPLPEGEYYTIRELLDVVLIWSACAATVALGEALCGSEGAFVARMNETLARLGIDAHFYDCYGVSANNSISPRGLAELARYLIAYYPEVLQITSRKSVSFNGTEYKNTNQLLGDYDGMDGLKTGVTDAAGYCFTGTAQKGGRRIIAVTMGSTITDRFPDSRILLDYGFAVADSVISEFNKAGDEAPSGGIGGFSTSAKSIYTPGIFSDVNENLWYGANNQAVIQKAYELQIMSGKGDGVFDPAGNITLAEAIKMAVVVYDIYNGGSGSFTQGLPWYQVYLDYAISVGIIDSTSFDGDYERFATRAEMAGIFAGSVPEDELQEINTVTYLPDVFDDRMYGEGVFWYGDEIFKLYRAGVLTGNDSKGTFKPFDNITRAEAAAIICRIVIPAERKALDLSQAIISADYLADGMLDAYDAYYEFDEFNDVGYPRIFITTNILIKDFKYIEVDFDPDDDNLYEKSVICSIDELSPDRPFVVAWMEQGTIPHRGISFVDENGATRYFALHVSGFDGSLLITEF